MIRTYDIAARSCLIHDEINEWLAENAHAKIIDIKYAAWVFDDAIWTGALIIYEVKI